MIFLFYNRLSITYLFPCLLKIPHDFRATGIRTRFRVLISGQDSRAIFFIPE